jgi:uncharacterized protein YjbI with pentapeptide repeats
MEMATAVGIVGVLGAGATVGYYAAVEHSERSSLLDNAAKVNSMLESLRGLDADVGQGGSAVDTTTVASILDDLAAGVSIAGNRFQLGSREQIDAADYWVGPGDRLVPLFVDTDDDWGWTSNSGEWVDTAKSGNSDVDSGYFGEYLNAVRNSSASSDAEKEAATDALTELLANQNRNETDRSIDASGVTLGELMETESMVNALFLAGYEVPDGMSVSEFAQAQGWGTEPGEILYNMGREGVRGGVSLDGIKVSTLEGVEDALKDGWRSRTVAQALDFAGADFEGFDFTAAYLRDIDFTGAKNLTGTQLAEADRLYDITTGSDIDWTGVDFSDIRTYGWDVSGSNITGEQLAQSSSLSRIEGLATIDFSGVDSTNWEYVGGVDLNDTNISAEALFSDSGGSSYRYFEDVNFANTDFSGTRFASSGISSLEFIDSDLSNTTGLSGKSFEGLEYVWAEDGDDGSTAAFLKNLDWTGVDYTGMAVDGNIMDISDADPANLAQAKSLRNVSLAGMDFSGVDPATVAWDHLYNVDLNGASGITAEFLSNITYWRDDFLESIKALNLDFSGVDVSGVRIYGDYYGDDAAFTDLSGLGLTAEQIASMSNLRGVRMPEGLDWSGVEEISARFDMVDMNSPENLDPALLLDSGATYVTGLDGVDFSSITDLSGISSIQGFDFSGTTGFDPKVLETMDIRSYGGSRFHYNLGLDELDWTGVDISPFDARGNDWEGANITGQQIADAYYIGGGNFRGIDFAGVDFSRTSISGRSNRWASLMPDVAQWGSDGETSFAGALNVTGAQLLNTRAYGRRYGLRGLRNVSFEGIDFAGATNFGGRYLNIVDFSGATNVTGAQINALRGNSWAAVNLRGMGNVRYGTWTGTGADREFVPDGTPDGVDFTGIHFDGRRVYRWDFAGVHGLTARTFAKVRQLSLQGELAEHNIDWSGFDPSANPYFTENVNPYRYFPPGDMGISTGGEINGWASLQGSNLAGLDFGGLSVTRNKLSGGYVRLARYEWTYDEEEGEWSNELVGNSYSLLSDDSLTEVVNKLDAAVEQGVIPPYGEFQWMNETVTAHPDH